MEIVQSGDDMKANKDFVEPLGELSLDTLDGIFSYNGPGYMRTHANRDNFHIIHEARGRKWEFFLKRHRGFEVKEVLKLLMTRSPFVTAGRREWDNILTLDALGIPVPTPVAWGGKRFCFFEIKSFVITARIPGGVPLDDYLTEQYSGPLGAEALRQKRALLWEVGALFRTLHQAGLTHMDLYLNHLFVSVTDRGEEKLHLIDLQRVARRWLFKRRWVVKDLAAFFYSTRNLPLSRTDIARVLASYFDGRLTPAARRLVRTAIKRAAHMAVKL